MVTLPGMDAIHISRRNFLAGTGAWLAAGAIPAPAEETAGTRTISILHTTDLHGHILPTRDYDSNPDLGGLARCATAIRQWRQTNPHTLLVDIGDVCQGTAVSHASRGALLMRLFNHLGYDAWTLGNHDFDWGPEALSANLGLSQAAVLGANLSLSSIPAAGLGESWKKVRPWVMREAGGFRIALIGLVTPGLPYWLSPETLGGVIAGDPAAALRQSIAEARAQKADAIVVMAHFGWRFEDDFANPLREILREAPGADALLAGHTHQDKASWMTEGVLCSQAAYFGIHLGRLELEFDLATRKLVDRKASTTRMDATYAADPQVLELAAADLEASAKELSRKVATVTRTFAGAGRDNEVAKLLCSCFAEALDRAKSPVDGVFHGTFGTGDLTAGDLTVGDCWKLLPYENLLTTAELDVPSILEVLREERSVRKSDRILWPFEVRFRGDGSVLSFKRDGKNVDPAARLRIAFNTYDAQSGGRTLMKLRTILESPAAKRVTTRIDTRTALIEGLQRRGTLA